VSLDIVIPARNEERRIGRTLEAHRSVIDQPFARFLVALDQCTDKTSEVVRSHARIDARVEIFEYPKLGKGGVLLETFRRCRADFIGFVDADGATPPAEFMRLVDAAQCADGAIASRSHPASVLPTHRSLARCLTSLVSYGLSGSAQTTTVNPLGWVAAAAAADAAGHGRASVALLARATHQSQTFHTYYGDAWVALGRALLDTRALPSCPPSA
jgi:glycosyltransferase involved in cell wall biosynthesis